MGREAILRRIRLALGGATGADVAAQLSARMLHPPPAPVPQGEGDVVARFIARASANLIAVERIASLAQLVPAVQSLLEGGEDDARGISVAPALRHVGWPADWAINYGPGRIVERLSVTEAFAGIAETGSIVMRSAPETPTSLNFLPDVHVVVLHAGDILARPEDVWHRMRTSGEAWPRTVNVISGASRTADVGGVIVRPAHGPKRVHVLVVGG